MQPLIALHESVVQGLASSQLSAVASQAPVAVLQCSMPSQTSPSPALQIAAGDPTEMTPTHLPPAQVSTSVQALLSLQPVPSRGAVRCWQASTGVGASGLHMS